MVSQLVNDYVLYHLRQAFLARCRANDRAAVQMNPSRKDGAGEKAPFGYGNTYVQAQQVPFGADTQRMERFLVREILNQDIHILHPFQEFSWELFQSLLHPCVEKIGSQSRTVVVKALLAFGSSARCLDTAAGLCQYTEL